MREIVHLRLFFYCLTSFHLRTPLKANNYFTKISYAAESHWIYILFHFHMFLTITTFEVINTIIKQNFVCVMRFNILIHFPNLVRLKKYIYIIKNSGKNKRFV